MKKLKSLCLIALFAIVSNNANSQFAFSVSPGLTLNGASFGYKIDRFVPEFGFNYMLTRGSYVYKGKQYDSDQGAVVNYTDSYEVTLGYLLPRLGLKTFIAEKEDLKMFISAGVMKPFIFGKSITDGIENIEVSDEIEKFSLIGTDLSFGMEYFFSNNFSMSGQFGFRYFHVQYKNSYQSEVYNPDTQQSETYTAREQFKLSLNPTFSRISLNFYF